MRCDRAWRTTLFRSTRRGSGAVLGVSAASGFEFTDLAGRSHLGGGSHGSLEAGDSEVPILAVGIDAPAPGRTVDLTPLALAHFGVDARADADAA